VGLIFGAKERGYNWFLLWSLDFTIPDAPESKRAPCSQNLSVFRGGEWFTTFPLSFEGEGDNRGEVNKQPLPLDKGKGKRGAASL